MPHYFFDLTDDKIIHDKQLRDLKQGSGNTHWSSLAM